MQIEATNYNTTIQEAQAQKSEVEKSLSLFDSLLSNATKPTDITYDEYKKLSVEDIANLYPKESMPDEYDKAISLHTKAHASEDEILNQVLFDKELEFNGSEAQNFVSGMIDRSVNHWDMLKNFGIEPLKIDFEFLKQKGFIFPEPEKPSAEYLKQVQADYQKHLARSKEDKLTAEALFDFFAHGKMDYNQNKEYYKNSESTFRKHGQEILAIYDSIQSEYEKRVSEQKSALNNYTKNNKPNALA